MNITHLSSCSKTPTTINVPLFISRVRAGFPSPADDFIDKHLDLNELLVQKPSATYFAWAEGESLKNIGIDDGDLLIVDRSITAKDGDVVIAAIDGHLTCKILDSKNQCLQPANTTFAPIYINDEQELLIEGVVTFTIKQHHKN